MLFCVSFKSSWKEKKNKKHVCFIRAAACRSQDCVPAFTWSFTLSGGTQKRPVTSEWIGVVSQKKKEKKNCERNLSAHYAFLMPPSLCSHSSSLSPPLPPSFPTRLRQEELPLVPPFLHAFQGYPSASFSPPVSVWCPASLQPSLFVPFQSLGPHSSCHLHFSAFIPLSIPTGPSWPQCREPNCSWPCHRLEGSWHPTAYKLSVRSLSSWFDKIQAISNSLNPSYFYLLSAVVFLQKVL